MDSEDVPNIYFEVYSCLGRRIRTTKKHWQFITLRKHLEIAGREFQVQLVLKEADRVRVSEKDPEVFLYYKSSGKYYLCVVCRHLNGKGYIVTIYLTDRLKEGREVWQR